jgi:hypothetical protein
MEQDSQYHLGLWSLDGERRSYARPKKSFPSDNFISGVPAAPHALHDPGPSSISPLLGCHESEKSYNTLSRTVHRVPRLWQDQFSFFHSPYTMNAIGIDAMTIDPALCRIKGAA